MLLLAGFGSGALAVSAGCASTAMGDGTSFADEPRASGAASDGFADAALSTTAPLALSRLCTAAPSCLPDDDGTLLSPSYARCAETVVAADGGADDAPPRSGCRLDGDAGPTCYGDGGAGDGVDGTACKAGSDCAPGYDCVAGQDVGHGPVCRRYCCTGSSACDDHNSLNGGRTFCDIQRLAASDTLAPVCMPIKQCTLLKDGECMGDETCAIVTDKGDTGCVATGPRQAGETCDDAHCAAGLTCLGSAGDRHCYTLCMTTGTSACLDGQKCTTGSLFGNTSFGVCQ